MTDRIEAAVLGSCIGDALGVPVEFLTREQLAIRPVVDLRGFGTHRQPAGTWSDDTSLILCTVDSLTNGFNDYDMMSKFLKWLDEGAYTARGGVFDVGIATRNAITRFSVGKPPFECGCTSEYDNGNGSLMRILPLLFYLEAQYGKDNILCAESLEVIHNISALTHAHPRSQMACGLYLAVANRIEGSGTLQEAVTEGLRTAFQIYQHLPEFAQESHHYRRLQDPLFAELPIEEIKSSGYVVDTLESAIWCLMNTSSYKECVLKAVNMGGDTDTVAVIAGGLAGLHYGRQSIPEEWVNRIANLDFLLNLCSQYTHSFAEYEILERINA